MFIYPAHVLKNVNGEAYLRDYNYKMLPGTGPYIVSRSRTWSRARAITIRRRKDYWAEKHRRNVGIDNFDEIQQVVVRDQNLEFEMFKKGDLDYYFVSARADVGRGAELREHQARAQSEAEDLQPQPQRHVRASR